MKRFYIPQKKDIKEKFLKKSSMSTQSNKVKVLLCSPLGTTGGIAAWTASILEANSRDKNSQVELTQFYPNKLRTNSYKNYGILRRIYNGLLVYIPFISGLKAKLKEEKYDIAHFSSSASLSLIRDLLAIRLCKQFGIKSVIHFHFGRIPDIAKSNNWEWKLLKKVVDEADLTIVMDAKSHQTLKEIGFSGANSVNLPNPLSYEVKEIIDNYTSIKRIPNSILYAGHIYSEKGIFELIDACKHIPNVKLTLMGAAIGTTLDEIKKLAGANYENWLEIKGNQPKQEVIKAMRECSIYTLPSYTEGFPNVIIEAMASSCTIVATTVGAIPEMIGEEDGKACGILIPPRNADALKNALTTLLSDKEKRQEYSENARQRAFQYYDIDIIWCKLSSLWLSCLTM